MNAIELLKNNGINTEDFSNNYTLTKFEVKNYSIEEKKNGDGSTTKIFKVEFENPTKHPYAVGIHEIECCEDGGVFFIYNL